MKNGYYTQTGNFAPETGIGTGAANPLVNEYDAAVATPTVDESTLGAGKKSKNQPRANEPSDVKPSGAALADKATNRKSTGEDEETRSNPNAHADDADVNKVASATRPAAPQGKAKHNRPDGTPTTEKLQR